MSVAMETPSPVAAPPWRDDNPYKFLDYFEESDEPSFAGRNQDIAEVLSKIGANRTLVLFGRSGLGKTSLLKAGVFPRLRERGFLPVYARTLTDPLADLRAALEAEATALQVEPAMEEGDGGLRPLVAALATGRTLVIVLDQFEELFTLFRKREDARNEFIDGLADLVDEHALRLRVVLSLREDYLAELEAFRRRLPNLLESRYRLGPLTAFGAREAIVRPLKYQRIEYSQALATRLLDLLAEDGFDPPMLQIVCTEVYREAYRRDPGRLRLTVEDLEKVGGLDGIFSRYLDNVTGSIAAVDLLLTRMVLDALITQEGTKRAVTADILASQGRFAARPEEIGRVLSSLERLRLLRRERRGADDWYELIHEKLVEYVRAWVILDRDFSRFQGARDLIINGSRGEFWRAEPGALLNRGQIDDMIGPFRDRLKLDPVLTEYVARGAIFSGSESAAYWADRLDRAVERAASVEFLLQCFRDTDFGYRLGAAQVAGQFPDHDGRIAGAALSLGDDPEVEVRRAVGRSLAALRKVSRQALPAAELSRLQEVMSGKLAWRNPREVVRTLTLLLGAIRAAVVGELLTLRDSARHRGPAAAANERLRGLVGRAAAIPTRIARFVSSIPREVIATRPSVEMTASMVEAGDPLEGFSFWERFWARRLAARRLRERYEESIKAQSIAGALSGVLMGVLWGLMIWSVSYFYSYQNKGSSYKGGLDLPGGELYGITVCTLLGAVLGWVVARAAAGRRPEPLSPTGAKASLAWHVGIGTLGGMMTWPVLESTLYSSTYSSTFMSDVVPKVIAVAACAASLGGIAGWLGARTAAPEVVRGDFQWRPMRLFARSWIAKIGYFLYGTCFVIFYGNYFSLTSEYWFLTSLIYPVLSGIFASVLASATIESASHVASRCLGRSARFGRWTWPIIAGVAVPYIMYACMKFLLFYMMSDHGGEYSPYANSEFSAYRLIFILSLSFLIVTISFSRIAACSRACRFPPSPEEPAEPSRAARRILLVSTVLAAILWWAIRSSSQS